MRRVEVTVIQRWLRKKKSLSLVHWHRVGRPANGQTTSPPAFIAHRANTSRTPPVSELDSVNRMLKK
jgi:hypothetical protein